MAIDYAYDIELSGDKKHLTLTVELPERLLAREPIIECNNNNALDIIRENGYSGYEIVQAAGTLSNWVSREGKGGRRTGTWVFKKDVPVKKTTSTAKKTTKKTTTKTTKTS